MTNSRAKGARVERDAAAFLCSLGFAAERNGRNGYSADDLRCPALAGVHIEVKGDESIDIWTKRLEDAYAQARENAGDRVPVVLWKRKFRDWCLTWCGAYGVLVTTVGGTRIKEVLIALSVKEQVDG